VKLIDPNPKYRPATLSPSEMRRAEEMRRRAWDYYEREDMRRTVKAVIASVIFVAAILGFCWLVIR